MRREQRVACLVYNNYCSYDHLFQAAVIDNLVCHWWEDIIDNVCGDKGRRVRIWACLESLLYYPYDSRIQMYNDDFCLQKAHVNLDISVFARGFVPHANWSLLTLDGPQCRTTALFQTLMPVEKITIVERDEATIAEQKSTGCQAVIVPGTLLKYIQSDKFANASPNILNFDYMGSWLGTAAEKAIGDSPFQAIGTALLRLFEAKRENRIVLSTTFCARSAQKKDYHDRVKDAARKHFNNEKLEISEVGSAILEKIMFRYYGWRKVASKVTKYSRRDINGQEGQQMINTCYRLERRGTRDLDVRWLRIDNGFPGYPPKECTLDSYEVDRIRSISETTLERRRRKERNSNRGSMRLPPSPYTIALQRRSARRSNPNVHPLLSIK